MFIFVKQNEIDINYVLKMIKCNIYCSFNIINVLKFIDFFYKIFKIKYFNFKVFYN